MENNFSSSSPSPRNTERRSDDETQEYDRRNTCPTTNQEHDIPSTPTLAETRKVNNLIHFIPLLGDAKRRKSYVFTTKEDEIISTELKLFDESWITKNIDLYVPWNPRNNDVFEKVAAEREQVPVDLSRLRFQGDENSVLGVSTDLKLYENPWKITKKLQASDVGHMSRLLLGKEVVCNHILEFLTVEEVAQIFSNDGLEVSICDLDMGFRSGDQNLFRVRLKYWKSSKSFIIMNGWSREFVRRRGLRQGDEIGLYWDLYYRRFHFRLLQGAPKTEI